MPLPIPTVRFVPPALLAGLLVGVPACGSSFSTADQGGSGGTAGGNAGEAGSHNHGLGGSQNAGAGGTDPKPHAGGSIGSGGDTAEESLGLLANQEQWHVVYAQNEPVDFWFDERGALCAEPTSIAWWGWPVNGSDGPTIEAGEHWGLGWEFEAPGGTTVTAHVGPAPGSGGSNVFQIGPMAATGAYEYPFGAASALEHAGIALQIGNASGSRVCLLRASLERAP